MGIKSFYASHISPLLRRTELGERLAMALVAFQAKMQLAVFVYADSGSKIFPDSETDAIFSDLDERSREIARRFMGRQLKGPPNGLMLHPKYFYTEEEKTAGMANMEKGFDIQRYKGLGEMDADQLWDTTMNPETRTLKRVTMKDAVTCNEIFDMLMGDRPEARRKFIEENATRIENLDV